MASKNNITGDEIKSKPLSQKGRDNWDNIFLKTPQQWCDILYTAIVFRNYNGFNLDDGVTWDTPMKKAEFLDRIDKCKVSKKEKQ